MGPQWYVLHTYPRVENRAAVALGQDEFEVFLPKIKIAKGRQGSVESPMFPGYLFIRCMPEFVGQGSFHPIHCILGWVRFDGHVPSIPDDVIEELAAKVEQIDSNKGLWRQFPPGEKVQVTFPHMESLAQVVQEAKSPQGRATVLLQFMGQMVRAQVPWEHLKPVENSGLAKPRVPRRTRGGGRWVQSYKSSAVSQGSD
jgi:transcriptional antiterminator RfaH